MHLYARSYDSMAKGCKTLSSYLLPVHDISQHKSWILSKKKMEEAHLKHLLTSACTLLVKGKTTHSDLRSQDVRLSRHMRTECSHT